MTKHSEKVQKLPPGITQELWDNLMITDMHGFSLRYLLPRRWWPKDKKGSGA